MPAGTRSKFAKGSSGGSGGVSSVTNTDGTLTFNPTTGAVVGSLNLGSANTWTAVQTWPVDGVIFTPNPALVPTPATGQLWYSESEDLFAYSAANLGGAGAVTAFLAPLVNGDETLWCHPLGGADDSPLLLQVGQDELAILGLNTSHGHPPFVTTLTIGGTSGQVPTLVVETYTGNVLDDGSSNMTVQGVMSIQGVLTLYSPLQEKNDTTGSGTALLGANCPATTVTSPHAWMEVTTSDGSNGYIPVWV